MAAGGKTEGQHLIVLRPSVGWEFGETNPVSAVAIQDLPRRWSVLPVALPGIGRAFVNPKAPLSVQGEGEFCRVAGAVDLCRLATCSVDGESPSGP